MAEALINLGIALNVVFWIVILVGLVRARHSLETRQVVKWAILLMLLPGLGVLGLYLERSDSYGLFFVVMLVALAVLGLVLLARDRHSMETRQVVKWAILLVLLPGLGTLGYFFWRLENAAQHGPAVGRAVLRKPNPGDR